jgi:hypothetical protein
LTYTYQGYGIGLYFEADVYGGYELPVSYLYTYDDNILVEPKIYLEVASNNYLTLITPDLQYTMSFEAIGF